MIKVIATDLDGTLFYPKSRVHMIPKKNRVFLKRFIEDGGRLVVVTSRHKSFTDRISKVIGAPVDVIGINGCFIQIDGELVQDTFFDPEGLRQLVYDLRDNYDPKLMMLTTKTHSVIHMRSFTSFGARIMYFIYEAFQGVYHEEWRSSDQLFFQGIQKGEAYKLMILVGLSKKRQKLAKKITEKLQHDYPQFDFVWLNQFIEITPKGCNKANGLSIYLDKLGVSKDNVAVVGDSGNDVPMFRLFHEQSYCMAHSPQEIRAEAAHVIKSVSDLEMTLYPSEDSNQS